MSRARNGGAGTRAVIAVALAAGALAGPAAAQQERADVLKKLNSDDTVRGTEQIKSYKRLFDAYLKTEPPPVPISATFNLTTIYPGISNWDRIRDWAESNPGLAEAILRCRDTVILGLPYGADQVDGAYRDAGLVAEVAVGADLHNTFSYLDAIDVIAAYATAEMYVRLEARNVDGALELAVAFNWMLRELCDRQFHEEKLYSIQLLIAALANLRDAFYTYQNVITPDKYRGLAWNDIPELRPDRNRLHIPEGDRVVSEALLEAVFDKASQPDPDAFSQAFASIQSADAPLTRFGAARRWRMIAAIHGSLEASQERLALIYDDWWRRWRVEEYDPILDTDTQFERTNPVRYAAVIYSMQDIEEGFLVRNELVAAVNGTAISAGLCAYKVTYGVYPDDKEKLYGQFVRKTISDNDPYNKDYGPLRYRLLAQRETIDTPLGRVQVPAKEGLLYSVGQDHADDRGRAHTDDGAAGDLVLWPPLKALQRQQGLK